MQAGAGTAGELTPCTMAATPACRLRLRGDSVGQGQAGSQQLGKWPWEGQGQPAGCEDLITTTFTLLTPPGSPSHGASSGGSCAPRAGSSLSAQWDRPYWRFLSTSVPGACSLLQPQNHTPRCHRKRQELALGSPPSSESLLLCASLLVPACSPQRCFLTHQPPAPLPQEHPFPRSTPAAGVEVGAQCRLGRPASRLAPGPLHLLVEWSTKALCPT